jgi:hypothetical protein
LGGEIRRELIESGRSARPNVAATGACRLGADGLAGRLRCFRGVAADRKVVTFQHVRFDGGELA